MKKRKRNRRQRKRNHNRNLMCDATQRCDIFFFHDVFVVCSIVIFLFDLKLNRPENMDFLRSLRFDLRKARDTNVCQFKVKHYFGEKIRTN